MKQIRSYVKREGRITKKQREAVTKYWARFGLELQDGIVGWQEVFGNSAPVILEIGFGMGQSLLEMALANPQQNYLGIEVHKPGVGALLAELANHDLHNVKVYRNDALEVLRQCIADNSLAAVLLFFPDPWPKRRHHKRRIVQTEFIELIYKKLQQDGYLHVATDWEDYAFHIQAVLKRVSGFVASLPKARPLTKFERRGKRLGHKIWDLVFIKTGYVCR